MSGDLHSRREMDATLRQGEVGPVTAARSLADVLNRLVGDGFEIHAEGFDVLIPGGTVTGVVFLTADGIWHVAENR